MFSGCPSVRASVLSSSTELVNTLFWKRINDFDANWRTWSMGRSHHESMTLGQGGQRSTLPSHMAEYRFGGLAEALGGVGFLLSLSCYLPVLCNVVQSVVLYGSETWTVRQDSVFPHAGTRWYSGHKMVWQGLKSCSSRENEVTGFTISHRR